MLYDNALLAFAYIENYQTRHRDKDAQKAREIFTYVLRDMAGPLDAPSLTKMRKVYFSDFRPFGTLLYQEGTIDKYLPWMKDYRTDEETTTAYLCQNLACLAPVTSPENLASLLNEN